MKKLFSLLAIIAIFLPEFVVAQVNDRSVSTDKFIEQELDTLTRQLDLSEEQQEQVRYILKQNYAAVANLQDWDWSDREKKRWYMQNLEAKFADLLSFKQMRKYHDLMAEKKRAFLEAKLQNYWAAVGDEIKLDDKQEKKLVEASLKNYDRVHELREQYRDTKDKQEFGKDIKESKETMRTEMQIIMTAEQFQSYQQNQLKEGEDATVSFLREHDVLY
ncbi:MAG: hypothetical protein WD077_08685 [Bacteroidia bacterium]